MERKATLLILSFSKYTKTFLRANSRIYISNALRRILSRSLMEMSWKTKDFVQACPYGLHSMYDIFRTSKNKVIYQYQLPNINLKSTTSIQKQSVMGIKY